MVSQQTGDSDLWTADSANWNVVYKTIVTADKGTQDDLLRPSFRHCTFKEIKHICNALSTEVSMRMNLSNSVFEFACSDQTKPERLSNRIC